MNRLLAPHDILIVDDRPDDLDGVLKCFGTFTRIARNGEQAFFEILRRTPSVLICEMQMADIVSARELALLTRAQNPPWRPICIAQTREPSGALHPQGTVDFDHHFAKPISPMDLLRTLF